MFKNFKGEDFIRTKGNFTADEIIQQPQAWIETVLILEEKLPEITKFMERCAGRPNLRVCVTGAGSSGYCADMLAAAANLYLGYKTESPHTTDIVGSPGCFLRKDVPTLLISLARSGNSPESVGAVKYARENTDELFEICVTCAKKSLLSEISSKSDSALKIVLPEKTCDRGFAMTSSFTSMAVAAYGILSYKNFAEFKNNILTLASTVADSLDEFCDIAQKAVSEKFFDRAAFLGAGVLKGAAREASLKLCELTAGKINVVSDTPLGFRHGPKSMITDDTFILHFVSCDALTQKYDMDLLRELISQKGANKILAAGDKNLNIPGADYKIAFNTVFPNDFYLAVAGVVFSQVFAFFKSQDMGVATDNPCPGGEVNRVVKGVRIY